MRHINQKEMSFPNSSPASDVTTKMGSCDEKKNSCCECLRAGDNVIDSIFLHKLITPQKANAEMPLGPPIPLCFLSQSLMSYP